MLIPESIKYSKMVKHDTLSVAVYGMVRNEYGDTSGMPEDLKQKVRFMFIYHYDEFLKDIDTIINENDDKKYYEQLKGHFIKLKTAIDNGQEF